MYIPATVSAEAYVAEVNGEKYTDYKEAWNAVKGGGRIEILAGWNTKGTLKVLENALVTIKANGYRIDRNLKSGLDAAENGTVIRVGKKAELNVYNAMITGGQGLGNAGGIYINEEARVNLYDVIVSQNDVYTEKIGQSAYGGGVMLDGNEAYLYMKDSHIDNNENGSNGGGLYISDYKNCTVELEGDSSISDNDGAG